MQTLRSRFDVCSKLNDFGEKSFVKKHPREELLLQSLRIFIYDIFLCKILSIKYLSLKIVIFVLILLIKIFKRTLIFIFGTNFLAILTFFAIPNPGFE